MKKVILILVAGLMWCSTIFAETTNPAKQLEKKIGTSLKALTGKSLNKKDTKKFFSEYVITLEDERGDGKITYFFNDKDYIRYKDYEEISSGAWRFTNLGSLRVFNNDVKLTWKIKLGKENNINIKPKYDPIGKLYKFEYQPKEVFLIELNNYKEQKQTKKKRLEQEKLNAQKKADEEKKRLKQENLDAQKKADEEKKRLKQENLDAQKKVDEEKKRLKQENLDAQKKADEEKAKLEKEIAEQKIKLEKEIAEQKIKLEEEKAKLEKEIAEQKRKLEEEKLFYDLETQYKKKCKKKIFNDLYEVGTPEYRTCILNKGPEKQIEDQKLKEKLDAQKKVEDEKKSLEQEKLDVKKKAGEEKKRLEQEKLNAQKKADEEKKRLEKENLDAQKKNNEEKIVAAIDWNKMLDFISNRLMLTSQSTPGIGEFQLLNCMVNTMKPEYLSGNFLFDGMYDGGPRKEQYYKMKKIFDDMDNDFLKMKVDCTETIKSNFGRL